MSQSDENASSQGQHPSGNGREGASRRHGGYSRGRHRDAAHDSAHAGESAPDMPAPPNHPLIPREAATLIDTDAGLSALIAHLRDAGSFAYDSEFIGELSYVPKLCLIQVATTSRVALIDPLAKIDLTPFWRLLADPTVLKIVHAGQQDVEPVVRFIDQCPANLFDTQIAAGLMAMPYPVSLSKLVMELAGARLGKGLTFTHWDQRPLSSQQLRYAADDVRYLPAVYDIMRQSLDRLGHLAWAMEESASICVPGLYRFDPETQYLRVRGAGSLQPKQLAVLKELTIWRDECAREADSPPRAYLKDEVLVDLARGPIHGVEQLSRVRGLPRPIEQSQGRRIVATIERGLAMPQADWPTPRDNDQSPGEKFKCEAMWTLVQALAAGQSIDAALLISRQEMNDVYQFLMHPTKDETPPLMQGWRASAVGDRLTEIVQKGQSAKLGWNGSLTL